MFESCWDGFQGKRVVVFMQRYHLHGVVKRTWLDSLGVSWAELDDVTQWAYDAGDGPKGEQHPMGDRLRVPSTAIGLGVQLADDKWPEGWQQRTGGE